MESHILVNLLKNIQFYKNKKLKLTIIDKKILFFKCFLYFITL